MACGVIRTWTLSKLVGAFLDLSIAYVILCGSTFAYFASKFLGFFGLNLPCPCNGLFGNPNEAYCVQRFLVEYPAERISSVHSSVKSKFPFDLIYGAEENCQMKMNKCISFDDRPVELEGEASCSSVSDARKVQDSTGWELVPAASPRVARFDLKRKGVAYQRPKSGLRRRRKVASDNASAASYEPCGYDARETPKSSFTFNKEISGKDVVCDASDINSFHGVDKKDWENEVPLPRAVDLDLSIGKYGIDIENESILDELGGIGNEERMFTGKEENDVNALEQALKEEKAARTALYLELEKERNAAATAADEAMGMILRLQEEKASIEMQARQYQRMIEEKSAYDAEEMNLLKEILLRRERETYVLEKEVENYKQIILRGEQLEKGVPETQEEFGLKECVPLDCDEDPSMLLHEISELITKKEKENSACKISDSEDMPAEDIGHEDVANPPLDYETVHDNGGEQESGEDGSDANADSSKHDEDTPLVDVHVVGHELTSAENSSQNDVPDEDFVFRNNDNSNDRQFKSLRRNSDIPSRSPPMVASKSKLFREDEGSSLSAVDFERLKIENEVELLREKLRIIQEGRDFQLRDFRLISAPERSAQQASVPVPSSKVEMKKRRSRSVSSGLNNSL